MYCIEPVVGVGVMVVVVGMLYMYWVDR